MKLTWHGHACFRLEGEPAGGGRGPVVVTDPYDPATSGYRPLTEPADVVVRSSPDDAFHNNAHLVPGAPLLVEALDLARSGATRVAAGVPFRAVVAGEAPGAPGGGRANAMYRFEIDGLRIGHMGDVGAALSAEQEAFFRGVDVLLALAGGGPTIALDDLARALDAIRPRLVVPMHFRTLRLKLAGVGGLGDFLAHFEPDRVDFAHHETATLHRDALPASTRVLVLAYS